MRRITIALSLLAIVACKPAAEPTAETTSPTAGSGAVQAEATPTTTTAAAGEGTGSGATAVTATNTAPGTGDALAAPSDVAAPPAGTPTTATGLASRVTLAYPAEVSIAQRRISVLSPVGRALLGRAVGAVAEVELPDGAPRPIRVLEVHYQPEASGDFNR